MHMLCPVASSNAAVAVKASLRGGKCAKAVPNEAKSAVQEERCKRFLFSNSPEECRMEHFLKKLQSTRPHLEKKKTWGHFHIRGLHGALERDVLGKVAARTPGECRERGPVARQEGDCVPQLAPVGVVGDEIAAELGLELWNGRVGRMGYFTLPLKIDRQTDNNPGPEKGGKDSGINEREKGRNAPGSLPHARQ
jgi:hypothetical protein